MSSKKLDNILSLLAATIFADHREHSAEIEVFLKAAIQLQIIKKLSPKITEDKLRLWYDSHKQDIGDKMNTPFYKDWIYNLLDQISDIDDKRSIISAMKDISKADGKVHINERVLFTLAAQYWGVE